MRKEEIRGIIVYVILIAAAIIVGFAAISPAMGKYGPEKIGNIPFILIVIAIAYLVNAFGLEILHVLGAVFGGYKITSFNVLSLCWYKTEEKWKFGFRDFNGICGETKYAPKKDKLNANLVTWFPFFGYALELAVCIILLSFVSLKTQWLRPAAIIVILISSMIAFYNFVPVKLDSMTDGYRIRLFTKPVNVNAYNKMLQIQEEQRLGKNIENIPVFDEITEYTAEINMLAMYMHLNNENFIEAEKIVDQLLENKNVLHINDYNRLIAQKLYLVILTNPIEEAKKLYDEICPIEIRRFIANDNSMPSIRAYVLIAGMIEGSQSEVEFAKAKVEKAKKKALASQIKAEEKLLDKAIEYVYQSHPKWTKENAAE